ncbi:MAG: ABC transporter ATP-binding protein [Oscillospiraceae bacterium]
MSGKKEEKVGIKRLVSNVFYVMKYACGYDRKMAVAYIASDCVHSGFDTFINTFILKEIIDALTNGADVMTVVRLLIIQLLISVAGLAIHIPLQNVFFVRLVKVSGQIQRELMDKAQKIDLECYDIPEYYDDFVIAASQSEDMVTKAVTSIARIAASAISMLIAGTMIMTVNPIVAVFPVIGFIINIITRFMITRLEYQYSVEKAKIGRKADYSKRVFYQPEYAKEIKLTGIEEALMEQYDEAIAEERKMAMKYSLKILPPTLINWIFTFTVCQFFAVPVYLAYLAIEKKSIQLGDVASLKNATNNIKSRLDGMNYALVDFQTVGQYAERFRRFMDYKINIEGCVGTEPVPEEDCTLELKNVCFRYKNGEKDVLRNVSMTIHKGEKLALVGENGAGKTTLIKLIMRLYDVTDGSITFGGVDIRKLDIKEYRRRIAAVFQDFQIYGATLAENVKTDLVDESDREKVVSALEKADLKSKLAKLPNGIDTELTKEFSDSGTMLSGGEAQKAAIARMFMRDMSVAILDEPSSALDPIAEYRLNKSMLENAENQAVILISHRLSTTKDADRIILLENGSIAESGTHSELLAKGGTYAKMWNVQAEKYCVGIYA